MADRLSGKMILDFDGGYTGVISANGRYWKVLQGRRELRSGRVTGREDVYRKATINGKRALSARIAVAMSAVIETIGKLEENIN